MLIVDRCDNGAVFLLRIERYLHHFLSTVEASE